jgi:hypothetical protein
MMAKLISTSCCLGYMRVCSSSVILFNVSLYVLVLVSSKSGLVARRGKGPQHTGLLLILFDLFIKSN